MTITVLFDAARRELRDEFASLSDLCRRLFAELHGLPAGHPGREKLRADARLAGRQLVLVTRALCD